MADWMASTKNAPKRSVLIVARLITTVVSIAGAEGVLWFGGYPGWWRESASPDDAAYHQADPELGWIDREGQYDLSGSHRNDPFRYTIWNGGRRATADRDGSVDHTTRPQVLFFGDSYVFGYGLADAETLPWIVQSHHPELEVANFGTPGYSTYQSYLLMKRWSDRAAFVFYVLNGFHEDRNVGEISWIRVVREPPKGFFFPYAEIANGSIEPHESKGERVWPLARRFRTVALIADYYQIVRSFPRVRKKQQVTDAVLASMRDRARSSGAKLAVILFDLTPKQRAHYRQFLTSQNIEYLDCDRPQLSDRSLRLPDGHPNEKMNALLAEWIEPFLSLSARSK